jgi:hypothetical protein
MGDNTGAPWNIPYVEPSDLVRDYPAADEAQALAIAAGLDAASVVVAVSQVMTVTNFTTASTGGADLTDVEVTVTPAAATNRFLMMFTATSQTDTNDARNFFRFRRDSTDLFEESAVRFYSNNAEEVSAMMFDESASDTSSRTYKIRARVSAGTMTCFNSSFVVIEYKP